MQLMIYLGAACGVISAVYWFIRRQSIRKGWGFTFHWWSLGDLAAGVAISSIAMLGIFLIEWLIGGIRVEGFRFDAASLDYGLRGQALTAMFEEFISRSLQLNGFRLRWACCSPSC